MIHSKIFIDTVITKVYNDQLSSSINIWGSIILAKISGHRILRDAMKVTQSALGINQVDITIFMWFLTICHIINLMIYLLSIYRCTMHKFGTESLQSFIFCLNYLEQISHLLLGLILPVCSFYPYWPNSPKAFSCSNILDLGGKEKQFHPCLL